MDFIVTIDTEADNQWARPNEVTTANTLYIPRFQSLCDRYGFKPTYLCTYEMVTDPLFQDTVGPYQEQRRAEIGAHLHPWSSPPFGANEEEERRHHTFPCELTVEVFRQKLALLTDAIRTAFGRSPTSYRAGRYGFATSHVDVLLDLGYRVDCSVAPFMSYVDCLGVPGGSGGADYRECRPAPYIVGREELSKPGDSGLLEVPITILPTRWPVRGCRRLERWVAYHPRHLAVRAMNRWGRGIRWFRPLPPVSASALIEVYQAAEAHGLPCAEMMFHSSELMPGCSPNFKDEAAIEALYAAFEALFSYMSRNGGIGVTLGEFACRFPQAGTSSIAVRR